MITARTNHTEIVLPVSAIADVVLELTDDGAIATYFDHAAQRARTGTVDDAAALRDFLVANLPGGDDREVRRWAGSPWRRLR